MLFSLIWVACKNVIDLNLRSTEPQLVIEGNITDETVPQRIIITRSASLDSPNRYAPVTNAAVKLINAKGQEFSLIQRTPGAYYSTSFAGRYNQTYQLRVQVDGKTYLAAATMPPKVPIDSIALSVQTFGTTAEKTIIIFYQDTPNLANYYRFILSVNGTQVKRIFTRDDQFNDGHLVQAYLYQDDIKLKSGDRVDIEMQCIEQDIYTYWYTFSLQSNGFTTATPTNPPNNFIGSKPLGYFSVHTTEHRNIIIP
ncbi:hypothetical protein GCM10022392_24460 [Mucilaginibacter panaciglaebae]|uniref:DUF4249 domain-containing protein n=2 Tax=Mucilaginibacter panaciglaebae TaxID=502331 RepID=A0ABP7WXN1_9SPHI